MEKIHEIKSVVHQLPEKKRYAELITAVLSVPVLITVLMANINNLRKPNTPPAQIAAIQITPTPSPRHSPTVTGKGTPVAGSVNISPTPDTSTALPSPTNAPVTGCIKEVGPVDINSPGENETISKDPVAIDIHRGGTNYCEVVWSYKINDDPWSEYVDKSIFLYNLSPGKKTVEIKVKSIASADQQILKRTFIVAGPPPTPTATASPSATVVE